MDDVQEDLEQIAFDEEVKSELEKLLLPGTVMNCLKPFSNRNLSVPMRLQISRNENDFLIGIPVKFNVHFADLTILSTPALTFHKLEYTSLISTT